MRRKFVGDASERESLLGRRQLWPAFCPESQGRALPSGSSNQCGRRSERLCYGGNVVSRSTKPDFPSTIASCNARR